MAYREVGMVQVREIVRRWLAGDGLRSIARALRKLSSRMRVCRARSVTAAGESPVQGGVGTPW